MKHTRVYDRMNKKEVIEKVYGEMFVSWLYDYKIGQLFTKNVFIRKPLSQAMGLYYSSRASIKKIKPFLKNFNIDMEEFVIPDKGFQSFNDFFIREFKPGRRPFSHQLKDVCAPAEGRYLAFENFSMNQTFEVKGARINVKELVRDDKLAESFNGGTCLIARLCPVDYHRFHFHDAGILKSFRIIYGKLHSVNPKALRYDPTIFMGNYREVSVFDAQNTGPTLYVEVGALGVGAIIQTAQVGHTVVRGQEKGYFEFGGSTVIMIFRKGTITLSEDILNNSHQNVETLLRLGETFAQANIQSH